METVDLVQHLETPSLNRHEWTKKPYQEVLSSKEELRSLLGLDETNFSYFLGLLQKKQNQTGKNKITISDGTLHEVTADCILAYPTAVAPKALLKKLPLTLISKLNNPSYRRAAQGVALWRKKMHAGLGSTIVRGSHIEKHTRRKNSEIGAKGTDLFLPLPPLRKDMTEKTVSFAEALLLQGILEAERKEYAAVLFHDIVSNETEPHFTELWKNPQLLDERWTYSEFIRHADRLGRTRGVKQAMVPTLDETGHLTLNRLAPAGHALFAYEAMEAALSDTALPHATRKHLVSFISNGEDLAASPSPEMVGWMIEEKIAIAMVVTEKTLNDKKGGQIALVEDPQHGTYITIIETAQAKNGGQLPLFEKLGLEIKMDEQPAYFNTNMALVNYDALKPRLRELARILGRGQFLEELTPELIENWKEQVDSDGIKRRYLQLEGAMGSTLLNLDRIHRKVFKIPLVHFLGVPAQERDQFFSPVKTAFDFFLQFYSDRFRLNPQTLKPMNQRPGTLPEVSLNGPNWEDVETVLAAFKNTSVLGLDSLKITGPVSLEGLTLKGKIEVSNPTAQSYSLSALLKNKVLKDCRVEISPAGKAHLVHF